jgi:hypothetical protein
LNPVCNTLTRNLGVQPRDHRRRAVHADHAHPRPGECHGVDAGTAADIQHALASSKYTRVMSVESAAHPIVAADLCVVLRRNRVVRDSYAQAGVLRPIDSVHTHVLQIGLVFTSSVRLNSTALGALRICSSVLSRMLPSDA